MTVTPAAERRAAPRFQGKTVLITGAARGQGAAEARLFAGEGAAVFVADVLDEAGRDLVQGICSLGHQAVYLHVDVSSRDDWESAVDAVKRTRGALHVLVNNAGIAHRVGLIDTTRADWDRVLAVDLTGPFLGIQATAPLIRDSGGGAIVNTGSIAGMTGHFTAAYGAAKWGLRGLAKAAALELVDWNIRVNTVHPGIVDTPIVTGSDSFKAAMAWMTPMARIASADEIAAVVAFLASDDASFVTGVDLPVDGGFTSAAAYRQVWRRARGVPDSA